MALVDKYVVQFESKGEKVVADGAKKIRGEVEGIDSSAKNLGGSMSALTNLIGPLVAGFSAVAAVRGFVDKVREIDALAKSARSLGVELETLTGFELSFGLAGLETQEGFRGLGVLNKRIAETAAGTGEARNLFKALGVEVKDQAGALRSVEEVLFDVSDKFQQLGSSTEATAAASKLFGDELGIRMIPLLLQGGDAMRAQRAEAERLGLVMSDELAAKAEQVNDAWFRLSSRFEGFTRGIVTATLPALADATDGLLELLGLIEAASNTEQEGLVLKKLRLQDEVEGLSGFGTLQPIINRTLIADREEEIAQIDAALDVLQRQRRARLDAGLDPLNNPAPRRDPGSLTLDPDAFNPSAGRNTTAAGARTPTAASLSATAAGLREATPELERYQRASEGAAQGQAEFSGQLEQGLVRLERVIEDFPANIEDAINLAVELLVGGFDLIADAGENAGTSFASAASAVPRGTSAVVGGADTLAGLGLSSLPGPSRFGPYRRDTSLQVATAYDDFGNRFQSTDPTQLTSFLSTSGGLGGSGGAVASTGLGAGASVLGAGSVIGAVVGEAFNQADRRSIERLGRLELSKPVNSDLGSLAQTGAIAGVGAAVIGLTAGSLAAGAGVGAGLGAAYGSAAGPIGAIAGAIIGVVVGLIIDAFRTEPQRADLVQSALEKLAKDDRSILQQGNFRYYRTGLDADRIFRPTIERQEFFQARGAEFTVFDPDSDTIDATLERAVRRAFVNARARGGAAGDDGPIFTARDLELIQGYGTIINDPYGIETDSTRLGAFGLGQVLTGGSSEDAAVVANTVLANSLLGGIATERETLRQQRLILAAAGIETPLQAFQDLGVSFFNANQAENATGGSADLTRAELFLAVEGVMEIFVDEIPKGVDALQIFADALIGHSLDVDTLSETYLRQVEIFGQLEVGLEGALRLGIGALLESPDPRGLQARGAPINEIIGAVGQRRAAGVSAINTAVGAELDTLFTEQLFDILKESNVFDALTTAAASGDAAGAAGLIPLLVGQALPEIEASLVGFDAVRQQLALSPTALRDSSESILDNVEAARINRLSPERQLAQLRGTVAELEEERQSLLLDGVTPEEATRLRAIAERRSTLGFAIAGLADNFGDDSASGIRKANAIFEEGLSIAEREADQFEDLANVQLDLIEATERMSEALDSNTAALTNDGIRLVNGDDTFIVDPSNPIYQWVLAIVENAAASGEVTLTDERR